MALSNAASLVNIWCGQVRAPAGWSGLSPRGLGGGAGNGASPSHGRRRGRRPQAIPEGLMVMGLRFCVCRFWRFVWLSGPRSAVWPSGCRIELAGGKGSPSPITPRHPQILESSQFSQSSVSVHSGFRFVCCASHFRWARSVGVSGGGRPGETREKLPGRPRWWVRCVMEAAIVARAP